MAGWHVVVIALSSQDQHTIRGPTHPDRESAETELLAIREAQRHELSANGTT
jgi:hypothetical protein